MFWAIIAIVLIFWVMASVLSVTSGVLLQAFIISVVLIAMAAFFAGRRIE